MSVPSGVRPDDALDQPGVAFRRVLDAQAYRMVAGVEQLTAEIRAAG